MHVDGSWKRVSDGTLEFKDQSTESGSDTLGSFKRVSFNYMAGTTPFVASIRSYTTNDVVVFEQSFPAGASAAARAASRAR